MFWDGAASGTGEAFLRDEELAGSEFWGAVHRWTDWTPSAGNVGEGDGAAVLGRGPGSGGA